MQSQPPWGRHWDLRSDEESQMEIRPGDGYSGETRELLELRAEYQERRQAQKTRDEDRDRTLRLIEMRNA